MEIPVLASGPRQLGLIAFGIVLMVVGWSKSPNTSTTQGEPQIAEKTAPGPAPKAPIAGNNSGQPAPQEGWQDPITLSIWPRDASYLANSLDEAESYCQKLEGWHLPTLQQLQQLDIDREKKGSTAAWSIKTSDVWMEPVPDADTAHPAKWSQDRYNLAFPPVGNGKTVFCVKTE
jgi:hypothetical protein